MADHPRPPTNGAFFYGPRARRGQGLEQVVRGDVLAVDVVEGAVVGLGGDGEGPVVLFAGAGFHLGLYEGVAHDADAVGVGYGDGRREGSRLPDPLQPRHLPVAVEPVGSGENGLVARQPLARTHHRHTRPHGSLADDERPFAAHDGRVSDPHTIDVGDRIFRPRRQFADPYPELAGTHATDLPAQGEDAVHLLLRQFEIENVEVFGEVLLARRLGDGRDLLLLHEPAQGHLGRRLAVGLAYLP